MEKVLMGVVVLATGFFAMTASADLRLSERYVRMGSTPVGTTVEKTLTVTNRLGKDADISASIDCRSGFQVVNTCRQPVWRNQRCGLRIRFTPQRPVHHNCYMTVTATEPKPWDGRRRPGFPRTYERRTISVFGTGTN